MVDDKQNRANFTCLDTNMPPGSFLSMNRCNVPAKVLGCAMFQRHPQALAIDAVKESYADIWPILDVIDNSDARALRFIDYFRVRFRLHSLEEAGYVPNNRYDRARLDARRLLLGWHFSADSFEAAVLKGWVESRFGLTPRFHHQPIRGFDSPAYQAFLAARSRGLYNTNALEMQLDLLYTFTQYEFTRRFPKHSHMTLFRGVSGLVDYEVLQQESRLCTVLLNNVNSFTDTAERAGEFGPLVMRVETPLPKILYFSGLLPGFLGGEREHITIGGIYKVTID